MVLLKDAEWSGWTDGPRFDEPVTDRFAPEIPDDLAVNLKDGEGADADGRPGRRMPVSRWKPFPGVRGAPGMALTMRG
jgi:hypothetical protein